jgi:hypothetical protein
MRGNLTVWLLCLGLAGSILSFTQEKGEQTSREIVPKNLIRNGDFEEEKKGLPVSWNFPKRYQRNFSIYKDEKMGKVLQFEFDTKKIVREWLKFQSEPFEVKPDTYYKLSFYVKADLIRVIGVDILWQSRIRRIRQRASAWKDILASNKNRNIPGYDGWILNEIIPLDVNIIYDWEQWYTVIKTPR